MDPLLTPPCLPHPTAVHVADTSRLGPSLLLPHSPYHCSPGTVPAQASVAVRAQDTSLGSRRRPPPPLPCAHPGRAPSALRLRSAGLTPAHVPLLVDPIRPCFCHWPAPPSSLAASPSRAVPACSGPTHAVHMPGQGTAWPQPGPPQPGSPVSQVAPALVACPVSHCYVHVCTWPLRLHGHLQLVPVTRCAQRLGHCPCLPGSLAAKPGGTAEDPNGPGSHCGPPE